MTQADTKCVLKKLFKYRYKFRDPSEAWRHLRITASQP